MHFTLEELGLLDAPAEQKFDNLTCLASELLDVPVAHISVADFKKNRIFYKSQYGHPDELAQSRELPMELTYCQHVPLTGAPVVVQDARLHPLLIGTPALSEGQPLAYLGIPVKAPGGRVIGGLCMMQPDERRWSTDEVSRAQKIAGCVSDLIRLETARLSSERLRHEQRAFTYAISHDLQSPANTLKMIFSELELEGECLSQDALMFIEKGRETVQRMGVQVQDVLTYARTLDAPVTRECVDLNALVDGILTDLEADIRQAGATVDVDDLPLVEGDPMQMRMLFQNLIGNALKFRLAGRKHRVSVSASAERQGHRVTVQDNGIGIRPEDQHKVFGLFNRLHLRDQYAGTGIGLSLCQRVAENHHFAIEVDSDGHSGTAFTMQFPEMPV